MSHFLSSVLEKFSLPLFLHISDMVLQYSQLLFAAINAFCWVN